MWCMCFVWFALQLALKVGWRVFLDAVVASLMKIHMRTALLPAIAPK